MITTPPAGTVHVDIHDEGKQWETLWRGSDDISKLSCRVQGFFVSRSWWNRFAVVIGRGGEEAWPSV